MNYPVLFIKSYDCIELLNKFAGLWKTEGAILQTDTTPEIKIWGTDTYEWLPGEYFLLHKVDVVVGNYKNNTFEIIGFDKKLNKYTIQHYDNKGNSGFMTVIYLDGLWTFLGETLRFNVDSKMMKMNFREYGSKLLMVKTGNIS